MSRNRMYAALMAGALLVGSVGTAAAQADSSNSGGAAGTGSTTSPAPGSNTGGSTNTGAGAPNPSR